MMPRRAIAPRFARTLRFACAALLLLAAAPAAAQRAAAPSSPAAAVARAASPAPSPALAARLDSARAILAVHRELRGIPGLSAAIAVDGELVWAGGFGYADLRHRVPATADTRYRIASISKPVAAVAAMKLVEEGRLDLDAPIQRYVPDFPAKRGEVTTRRLMSHTAGIRHYRGREFLSDVRYDDVFGPLTVFADDSLLFEPGTQYSYSTYGWTLVSAVVAGAAGEPFVDYLEKSVVEPLGLEALQPEYHDSIIPHHASFYQREDDGPLVSAPCVDLSNKWAGGGLVSTAGDLVRFALGLIDGRAIRPVLVDSMFTPQRLVDGESVDYGLGWRMDAEQVFESGPGGGRVIWHTGGAVGGSGVLLLYPDDDVVVSILANLSGGGHGRPARRVGELFVRRTAPVDGGAR